MILVPHSRLSDLFVPVILLYALSHAQRKLIVIIDRLLYIWKNKTCLYITIYYQLYGSGAWKLAISIGDGPFIQQLFQEEKEEDVHEDMIKSLLKSEQYIYLAFENSSHPDFLLMDFCMVSWEENRVINEIMWYIKIFHVFLRRWYIQKVWI